MTVESTSTIDASYALAAFPSAEPEVAAEQTPRAPARLVELSGGIAVAFSVHATHAVLENPQPEPVLGMSRHGYGLIAWQDDHIPMIDLATLLYRRDMPGQIPRYALIVGYRDAEGGEERHGAVGLSGLPVNVLVANSDQCDLPADSPLWRDIAISCFAREGRPVPIIDTDRLFHFHENAVN